MKRIHFVKLLFVAVLACGNILAWGADVTLSNANIVSMGDASTSYKTHTATIDGYSWGAYAIKNYHSKATNTYHYLQIKKYASNTAYYIQLPTFAGAITSIRMTVSSTSQPMSGGGNSATLYFSSSKSTSATGTGVASGSGGSSVTIDCSSLGLKTGYITAGGAVRVWDVTVTYESGSTETTVSFSSSSINFGTVTVGETKTQDVSVTINNPTPSVNFSVTGSGLSVSPSSLSQNGIVTVTYKPTTAGTLNGILTAYGGGLTTDVTASITATAQSSTTTYYTVTWKVGSDNSQTTQVAHGSKATPPITPNDNALSCADTFMGWTTAPITSSQSEAPTPLFKNESPEAITANTTFYAVFATKQNGN